MEIESVSRRHVSAELNYLHFTALLEGDRRVRAHVRQTTSYVLKLFEVVAVNDDLTGEAVRLTDEESVALSRAIEAHLEGG